MLMTASRAAVGTCWRRLVPRIVVAACSHGLSTPQTKLLNSHVPDARQQLSSPVKMVPQRTDAMDVHQNDAEFEVLCRNVVSGKDASLTDRQLIAVLHRLLQYGSSADHRTVECFEHRLLWRARKMGLHNLCASLSFHVLHQETGLQKKVVSHLRETVRGRVSQAGSLSDIIWLLDVSEHLGDHKFVLEVEDRALQLMSSFEPREIRVLVRALARLGLRPTPLLQAAAFYLGKGHGGASLKEVVTVMHALRSLSFLEPAVLQQLSEAFLSQLEDGGARPSLVSACLTSVGQMAWRHCELLEACTAWLIKHVEDCRPHDLAACLLTLAKVQYVPECADQLFPLLQERLTSDSFIEAPAVWLDLVWSLAALGKVQQQHLDSVLQLHFYGPLLEGDHHIAVPSRQKLLNLIAVRDLEFQDGPRFPKDVVDSLLENRKLPEPCALQRSVKEAMTNLAPLGRYLHPTPDLPYGIVADGEMVVDKNLQPVLLESPVLPEHKRYVVLLYFTRKYRWYIKKISSETQIY